jgi:hypothetical protein
MAETLAKIGYNTLLKMGDGVTPTEGFVTVAEVKSVDGFGSSTELLEATHMESPARGKEFIPGMGEGDTVTVVANFTPDNADVLKDAYDGGINKHFQLEFPDPLPTYLWTGAPTAWHINNVEPNGILEVETQWKISGGITEAP